jgi:hypothetical protein
MRLDFNVLWVEDQPAAVQAQHESISRALRKEGFRFRTEFARSVAEAVEYLSSDIYGDHIDLVLMDYDLGDGAQGDDGLVEVRNQFEFKEVIFYSSQATDLMEKVARKRIQGVYCSARNDLVDTVIGAFDALVKKVLDIDHARGIVMGATSDIDHLVSACLVAAFEVADDERRKKTMAVLARHMKDKRNDFDKEAALVEAVLHVSNLLEMYNVYTSNDRLRLLANVLELVGSHPDKVTSMKDYLRDTVPRRNLLAHHRVRVEGFSRKLVRRDGSEMTNVQMKTLRLELLQHQESFEALAAALGCVEAGVGDA